MRHNRKLASEDDFPENECARWAKYLRFAG